MLILKIFFLIRSSKNLELFFDQILQNSLDIVLVRHVIANQRLRFDPGRLHPGYEEPIGVGLAAATAEINLQTVEAKFRLGLDRIASHRQVETLLDAPARNSPEVGATGADAEHQDTRRERQQGVDNQKPVQAFS